MTSLPCICLERKILYPDNAYELGRGSILLHLAQTVVSTHHATITVGPHPLESAVSAKRPSGGEGPLLIQTTGRMTRKRYQSWSTRSVIKRKPPLLGG